MRLRAECIRTRDALRTRPPSWVAGRHVHVGGGGQPRREAVAGRHLVRLRQRACGLLVRSASRPALVRSVPACYVSQPARPACLALALWLCVPCRLGLVAPTRPRVARLLRHLRGRRRRRRRVFIVDLLQRRKRGHLARERAHELLVLVIADLERARVVLLLDEHPLEAQHRHAQLHLPRQHHELDLAIVLPLRLERRADRLAQRAALRRVVLLLEVKGREPAWLERGGWAGGLLLAIEHVHLHGEALRPLAHPEVLGQLHRRELDDQHRPALVTRGPRGSPARGLCLGRILWRRWRQRQRRWWRLLWRRRWLVGGGRGLVAAPCPRS